MATKTQVLRIETNGNAHIKMNNDSEWKDFTVNSHATAVIAQLAMTAIAHDLDSYCHSEAPNERSQLLEFGIER